MKKLITGLLCVLGTVSCLQESGELVLKLPAKEGTAIGKSCADLWRRRISFRRVLPMLGKILSQRHGFDCVVLFTYDKNWKYIDPNNHVNMAEVEELKDADLMIIGTRFRELSDEHYAIFADFLNAGKPVVDFALQLMRSLGKERPVTLPGANLASRFWVKSGLVTTDAIKSKELVVLLRRKTKIMRF